MSDPVTKIATLTPTSAVASFTSIPSTYDDLVLIGSAKHGYTSSSVYSANRVHINMNSDTGSNYSWSGLGRFNSNNLYGSVRLLHKCPSLRQLWMGKFLHIFPRL